VGNEAPSKSTGESAENDLQILLPAELRKRWVVIPRYELARLFLAAGLLVAATTLTIMAWSYGIRWLYWSLPVTCSGLAILRLLLKGKDRRYEEEAKHYAAKSRGDRPA